MKPFGIRKIKGTFGIKNKKASLNMEILSMGNLIQIRKPFKLLNAKFSVSDLEKPYTNRFLSGKFPDKFRDVCLSN
jgi:hypothetical protein